MTFCFTLLLLFAQGPELQIIDPEPGAYVSGEYEVVLQIGVAAGDVARTRLYVDDALVSDEPGYRSTITYDFGERIERRRVRAAVVLLDEREILSETVLTRPLRIDFEDAARLLLVGAVVKTRSNRPITGLTAEDFEVKEDGRRLEIKSFYKEQLPLDLVVLLDTSSSLRDGALVDLKRAAAAFISRLDAGDRVALYEFKRTPSKLAHFTNDRKRLSQLIQALEPIGETALFNALHQGLADLKGRDRGRKAIILFTDGRDSYYDSARDKARMMRGAISKAQNQEVAIFTLGLGNKIHEASLERIAKDTGGRYYHADRPGRLGATFDEILTDLKNQYILGVVPLATTPGFHSIEVDVRRRRAVIYARSGYTIE